MSDNFLGYFITALIGFLSGAYYVWWDGSLWVIVPLLLGVPLAALAGALIGLLAPKEF